MLRLENIYKKYRVNVLSDINFSCEKGEIVCIAGANGSGKSTLLSVLCGITRPSGGKVVNNANIGYVPQDNGLFENSSVKDNIDFWAAAKKTTPRYTAFSPNDMKKKVRQLSGGMKKRLSVCIALLGDYDFLILDEPTASLDIYDQHYILDIIRENKRMGKGVIFTSHHVFEIAASDRLYVLDKGRVVFEGPTHEFSSMEDISDSLKSFVKASKGSLL